MNVVPLQSVPSQRIKTTLDGRIVYIQLYQRRYGLFINIYIEDELMIGACICQNLNRIIRAKYLNEQFSFTGDFMFVDLIGNTDPIYQGLGTQYQLVYLSDDELDSRGFAA